MIPSVKERYSPHYRSPDRVERWVPCDDITEEEVERTIAEQLQCLPDWWPKPGENDTED
jgi:hypothetical protein